MLSPRKRALGQAGQNRLISSVRLKGTTSHIYKETGSKGIMASQTFRSLSAEQLLGPLNETERKFAPPVLFTAGPMEVPIPRPRVAIVGSRAATEGGLTAARNIARTLSKENVVIVSGLAKGIDTAAHKAAIEGGGRTVAVLGTPLDHVYPKENFLLQKEIMTSHLAISQFPIGHPTTPKDFLLRNRTMALVSNASVIVEAGETSGSLHQGWEALRLGRPLFIWKAILSSSLGWPKLMMRYGAMVLTDPKEIMEVLPSPERVMKIVLSS